MVSLDLLDACFHILIYRHGCALCGRAECFNFGRSHLASPWPLGFHQGDEGACASNSEQKQRPRSDQGCNRSVQLCTHLLSNHIFMYINDEMKKDEKKKSP